MPSSLPLSLWSPLFALCRSIVFRSRGGGVLFGDRWQSWFVSLSVNSRVLVGACVGVGAGAGYRPLVPMSPAVTAHLERMCHKLAKTFLTACIAAAAG